ncbi:MAG: CBS domain-containing protein, partial [Gemmatimonadota bacterium]
MANFEIPARSYMSSPLHTVSTDDRLDDVYERLSELGFSAVPVADEEGRVSGVISRTDLIRVGSRQARRRPESALLVFPDRTAAREMTAELAVVPGEAPLSRVAKIMLDDRVHRVFVEDEDGIVGIVTTRDLMRAIADKQVTHPLSRYMSSPLFTIRASEPIALATDRLEKAGVSGLVVVDDEWPVGVFTQAEALAAREVDRQTPVQDVMNVAILLLNAGLPLHRAAAQAAAMDSRRIVATEKDRPVG